MRESPALSCPILKPGSLSPRLLGVGGITLGILLLTALFVCVCVTFFFLFLNAASIFGGLLLRPPPGHPTPDITEKRKAQQFIHQFLLREDNLP